MNRRCSRLVLAALRGGAGKTTLSVALAVALQKRGIGVIPFKKGPDYIDAAWLSLAAAGPCYNLDTFLIGRKQVVRSFSRRAQEGSVALIEGNRGLYDGMNLSGEHSTAELAKLLRAPVVLVVDCDKVTRTTAAMVLGCQGLDPKVDIRAVILNRVGGGRHAAMVKASIEEYCHIPVLGVVPRLGEADFPFPERHLGLVPPQEHDRAGEVLMRAGELAEKHLDMESLIRVAQGAPPWSVDASQRVDPGDATAREPVTIGVIRDAAFQFYYHENIEALVDSGARIVEISAIGAASLPAVDALYIGGGFPETQAGLLAENEGFRRSLRAAAEKGLPIYAECGGFIYLGESLTIGDRRYPMVGALAVTFGMEKRPQGHGYTVLEVDSENPFYPMGMQLKGHEFHYCRVLSCRAGGDQPAFRVIRGMGMDGKRDGMTRKNILASFTHLHALGTPQWAPALVGAARRYHADRQKRRDNDACPAGETEQYRNHKKEN
jgi:cobyrinic acid a,c-diamide synthase